MLVNSDQIIEALIETIQMVVFSLLFSAHYRSASWCLAGSNP